MNILKEQAIARELSRERKVTETSSVEKPVVSELLRKKVEKNIVEWIEIQRFKKDKEREERLKTPQMIEKSSKQVIKKQKDTSKTVKQTSPKDTTMKQIEIKEDKGILTFIFVINDI